MKQTQICIPKITRKKGLVHIENFNELEEGKQDKFFATIESLNCNHDLKDNCLYLPENKFSMRTACKIFYDNNLDVSLSKQYNLEPIDFDKVCEKALGFANFLRERKGAIMEILMGYETFQTAEDEFGRAINYLENISINAKYFTKVGPPIASFLPLNQPFYSLFLFGIIPSMMSDKVYVKPPTAAFHLFKPLIEKMEMEKWFNNIEVCLVQREEFVKRTKREVRGVVFTGSSDNIEKIRKKYPYDVLFLANGSGHNPLLITPKANIEKAIESSLRVVLYNQGQDCAAPNTILVHTSIIEEYKYRLIEKLKTVERFCGDYADKNTLVGPNSDEDHVIETAKVFFELKSNCIYGGMMNHIKKIIHPTVFSKPLKEGANFYEFFAPVFFIQEYETEAELDAYFLSEAYYKNAMYLGLFGDVEYKEKLIEKGIHSRENILLNTDLHIVEKGYLPYGGCGAYSSPLYHLNRKINSSILIPREIHKYLINVPTLKIEQGQIISQLAKQESV